MKERREGNHRAVHRLSQCYADVVISINEIEGIYVDGTQSERKHRALCLLREIKATLQRVVDTDLGLKLVEDR
jgi:hypothetical protein